MTEDKVTYAVAEYREQPVMSQGQWERRYGELAVFVKNQLRDGVDFGIIPGTDKPTLLKPGAEKLNTLFGLRPTFEIVESIEDWTGKDHGEPMFYYLYRCRLMRDGEVMAESDGSCNTMESKYRWRWVTEADIPAGLDPKILKKRGGRVSEPAFAIDKGETTGKYGKPAEYWQMFRDAIEHSDATPVKRQKRDGGQMDAWEIDMTMYRVPNEDVFSVVNTVQKMAQKRALIAATLLAVNGSEYFTQDVEDLAESYIEAEYKVMDAPKAEEPKPKPKDYGTSQERTAFNDVARSAMAKGMSQDDVQAVLDEQGSYVKATAVLIDRMA